MVICVIIVKMRRRIITNIENLENGSSLKVKRDFLEFWNMFFR